jgi:hypothetical protein
MLVPNDHGNGDTIAFINIKNSGSDDKPKIYLKGKEIEVGNDGLQLSWEDLAELKT